MIVELANYLLNQLLRDVERIFYMTCRSLLQN